MTDDRDAPRATRDRIGRSGEAPCAEESTRGRCAVCGTTIEGKGTPLEGDARACSRGCAGVWDTLGPIDPAVAARGGADGSQTVSSDGEEDRPTDDATSTTDGESEPTADEEAETGADGEADPLLNPIERTFLRIDGMHSPIDEAYLERVATAMDGVVDAEASYISASIRVDHRAQTVAPLEIRDGLSRMGFTAYLREETDPNDGETGPTRRSREMSGIRKRRADDMLEVRYILGVVFGSFLMLPYVTILYPAYLAMLFPDGPLQSFEQLFSDSGLLFLQVYFVLTGIVLYITGKPLLRGAWISLTMRRPTIDLLATGAILSAFAASTVAVLVAGTNVYFDLVIAIAALVTGALLYESVIKQRGLERLTDLTISQVDTARRLAGDGTTREVAVDAVASGDTLLVRAGERVPIDGHLAEGECTVDEAIVTGESTPVKKTADDELIGGSIVVSGAAVVDVGEAPSSSIDSLTSAVWQLQTGTHGSHRRIDALAGRVMPWVAGLSVVAGLAVGILTGSPIAGLLALFTTWFVGAPWMLGLSTPLSIAATIESALERGIVIFDETVFRRLEAVDTVVFDKTGTLTGGEMTVLEVTGPERALSAAAALERRAAHPVARAIVAAFGREPTAEREASDATTRTDGGEATTATPGADVENFDSHDLGVSGVVDGSEVLVGHPALFEEHGWSVEPAIETRLEDARGFGRLPVLVGRDGRAEGTVVVGDEARADWAATLDRLADRGLEVLIVTGDDAPAAATFDAHPAVSATMSNVSPAGKVAAIRQLEREGAVAMVGDGTNDAPALAAADLGISLGGGTDLAADAADVTIADDDLPAIAATFELATAALKRIAQTDRLALVYNAIVIPLVILGLLNPLFVIGAVVVGATLVTINAFRPLP